MPRLGLGIHEFRRAWFGGHGYELVDPKAKPWDDGDGGGVGVSTSRNRGIKLNRVLAMLFFAMLIAVAACGKKGNPVLPDGEKDSYPQSYPNNTDPQTGVFSN